MTVGQWPIERVIPYARNPRRNEGAVAKVAASLKEFGWRQPIVTDAEGVVIVGHTRLLAARQLGMVEVPVHIAEGLTPAQVKAYRLADNRVAEEAEWDDALLAAEFEDLKADGFDVALTGFDTAELDALLARAGAVTEGETDAEAVPETPEVAFTVLGDLWTLGRHRLLCGSATSRADVDRLTGGQRPQMAYNDPPYGVEIVSEAGTVSSGLAPGPALRRGLGGTVGASKPFGKVGTIHKGMKAKPIIEANTYAPIIGDDSTATAIASYQLCAALKIPVLIFWGGNYYAEALPPSSCWIVWDKVNGESFFADAELAWTNQKTAVRIFQHQWNGLIKASERGQKRVHPTQKPVALGEWCMETYGKPGDVVLDLFGGSGSTLIAAEKAARDARIMELAPHYCDVIVQRWCEFTGKEASCERADGSRARYTEQGFLAAEAS